MPWNWKKPDWPAFRYDAQALAGFEARFLLASGEVIGAVRHTDRAEQDRLRLELLSEEAVKTSAIEGDMLDRLSVQSSLRRHFGFEPDGRIIRPEERGIAELMLDVFERWQAPLDHETLFRWHAKLMSGRRFLEVIGGYRTHADAMQIISGRHEKPTVHFEAPPSGRVREEMETYLRWFNASAPEGEAPLPALTRAGLGHLHFESIHPFEDGNGRLGRALAEKSLAQSIGQPSLIALASTIERNRKAYYGALERHQRGLDITGWLVYFAETVLEAQQNTLQRVRFLIEKTRFHDRFRDRFNARQKKVIARLFEEGPEGFRGGLSAENYLAITKTSRATATRDLQDLVEAGALTRRGERRHTRYALLLPGFETGA